MNTSSGSNFHEEEVTGIDVKIWGNLPQQLVERILAFLPLDSLLRMRAVCKRWSVDITGLASFAKLHAKVSPTQKPWFIIRTGKRRFSAYDINSHRWHELSVSCLPDPDLQVLASSKGLLCYGFRWGEVTSTDLYVCNPVTRVWRHLPPHPVSKMVDHFGMSYDEDSKAYRILTMTVSNTGASIQDVFVYDSATNEWMKGVLPKFSMHFSKAPMVWSNGCFYFMDRIRPFCELYEYNLEQSLWSEIQSAFPEFFEYASLAECEGRLFMVGLHKGCRKIWEVTERSSGMEWLEYDTLPFEFPNEFRVKRVPIFGIGRCPNSNPFRLNCIGSSNLICFTSNLDHTWVLIYNTSLKTWHWAPKHVSGPGLSDYAGVSFQPSLDAHP